MSAEESWVEFRPYDHQWPVVFEREATRIRCRLGMPARRVGHFGSTALPGLVVKPIVDILIGTNDDIRGEDVARALRDLECEYLGDDGRRTGAISGVVARRRRSR